LPGKKISWQMYCRKDFAKPQMYHVFFPGCKYWWYLGF
jgi:hypothetical protein